MSLFFRLHYRTEWGEQLAVQYAFRADEEARIFVLETQDGEIWSGEMQETSTGDLRYRYVLLKGGNTVLHEWGEYRQLSCKKDVRYILADHWRPREAVKNAFLSSAFTQAVFARAEQQSTKTKPNKSTQTGGKLMFQLRKPDVSPVMCVGIIGNIPQLGGWKKAVLMDETHSPLWAFTLDIPVEQVLIEYKFVICHADSGEIHEWEWGENRRYLTQAGKRKTEIVVITEEEFRTTSLPWKGAGVAIPVFSLRSHRGLGIGEFADLIALTDWSAKTGLSVIQILPVNDTIATGTWVDSYPYAAISVFALQPLYIRIEDVASFQKTSDLRDFEQSRTVLNAMDAVDFEKVLQSKMHFLRILYQEQKHQFFQDSEVNTFLDEQGHWLKPYAIFCHLRDKYQTCNFRQWPSWSKFDSTVVETLAVPSYEAYDDVRFWFFVQFHADKQLASARNYARQHSVVLKGDLPIGIYRYSCDAWVAPELYNMKEQAGAPPDDYAIDGQNWGFPTYNWQIMAQDDFSWWKMRMQQLNRYFDALRIDHILGFFRIWQIPTNQIAGTLGMFNPRLPLTIEELRSYGIHGDLDKYVTVQLSGEHLSGLFGPDTEDVVNVFFREERMGWFVFRSAFPDQMTIRQFCYQHPAYEIQLSKLLRLKTEVLLLEEPGSNGQLFNPRITIQTTMAYQNLSQEEKTVFDRLYHDYYYQRHNTYWQQQALWKLPALLDASDMLICGEDLGMIPATVPGVMRQMNIISLEIQRMPKGSDRFGKVREYPYFSVCSPSCHDMSTIRGWWESDHGQASSFYHDYLHWYGEVPTECNTEIVQAIVEDHLASPSMMAIFPIQDLLGMDRVLRREEAASEQINDPSNSKHYWKYRFHLPLEDLINAGELNARILQLVRRYGR